MTKLSLRAECTKRAILFKETDLKRALQNKLAVHHDVLPALTQALDEPRANLRGFTASHAMVGDALQVGEIVSISPNVTVRFSSLLENATRV
jgi:hypothetical protein